MPAARDFRELIVWQKAMDMAMEVYQLTGQFPKAEVYGLTSQARRAAVSIASNIAEGAGRGNDNEFVQFLRIGNGSLRELQTQLLLAQRLGFADSPGIQRLLELASEVARLSHGLIRSLRKPQSEQQPDHDSTSRC